jgi:predicted dehydrogenase
MTPRIGLLGVAHLHVDAYIDNLRTAGAEVVGVTDADPVRGRQWAAQHGMTWFESAASLLAAGVDGVLVCSETARHRDLVEQAAAAGAAVLCEKPLATTAEDSAAIVAACRSAGVPLMTAFPMRFSPVMRDGVHAVREGRLGQVLSCVGTNQGRLPMAERAWFVDPALSGGGALIDHVVHLADILRWMLGNDPVEVYAVSNRILHGQVVGVETGGLVVLTFADGTFASIDSSWSRPARYPTWGGMALEVVGEGGVLTLDAFSQFLTVYDGPQRPLSWPGWGSDPNQGLIDEFVAVCAGRTAPSVTGDDGDAATRIALAAIESARTGRPVRLADLPESAA